MSEVSSNIIPYDNKDSNTSIKTSKNKGYTEGYTIDSFPITIRTSSSADEIRLTLKRINPPQSSISQLLFGRNYIEIKGEDGISGYAKISQLSRIFKVSKKVIQKTSDLISWLETSKSVSNITNDFFSKTSPLKAFSTMIHVVNKIKSTDHLKEIISGFHSVKIIQTIMTVGMKLGSLANTSLEKPTEYQATDSSFGFTIDKEENVFIRGSTLSSSGQFKMNRIAIKLGDKISQYRIQTVEALESSQIDQVNDAQNEAILMQRLCNLRIQNVMKPYLVTYESEDGVKKKFTMIQTEFEGDISHYFSGGSNEKEILKHNNIRVLLKVLSNAANGLAGMHRNGIVHFDVTPENILINNNEGFMTDFGLSRQIEPEKDIINGRLAKKAYFSPEEFQRKEKQDPTKIDSFSLGLTLFTMLTGFPPSLTIRDDKGNLILNKYGNPIKVPFGGAGILNHEKSKLENHNALELDEPLELPDNYDKLIKADFASQIRFELNSQINILIDKMNKCSELSSSAEKTQIKIKKKELKIRINALKGVCAGLLVEDPNKRLSCSDASKKLKKLSNKSKFGVSIIPDPPIISSDRDVTIDPDTQIIVPIRGATSKPAPQIISPVRKLEEHRYETISNKDGYDILDNPNKPKL